VSTVYSTTDGSCWDHAVDGNGLVYRRLLPDGQWEQLTVEELADFSTNYLDFIDNLKTV
jgi:hypothetical protein